MNYLPIIVTHINQHISWPAGWCFICVTHRLNKEIAMPCREVFELSNMIFNSPDV
jgi:hypothetical protein